MHVCVCAINPRGVRMATSLAELNGQSVWSTDVGNAYLESETQEKVCITGGPESEELHGHVLVVKRALHGLKSSSLRWHERSADVMRDMGLTPLKAGSDIWMREADGAYEHAAMCVDDLDSPSSRCTAELSAQRRLTLGLRSSKDVVLTR